MAAQNSLGSGQWQAKDSAEIWAGRQYISDADRLLLFVDDAANPRIYRIEKDATQPVVVCSWSEDRNSASPDFFREVLVWMRQQYPAQEYGLVLWSHADGWIPSIDKDYATARRALAARPLSFAIDCGEDMASDDGAQMDVDDMAEAIIAAGIHPRYIFFDACLMQNVEVAYALKDATDYVIGSPSSTAAIGSNYTNQLRNAFFNDDPTRIVPTYYADLTATDLPEEYKDFGAVISAIRTDRLEALAAAFKKALPYSLLAGQFSPNMDGVLNYQAYARSYFFRPHNYDAAEAVRQLFPQNIQDDLLEVIDEAIVRKAATSQFWIGPGYFDYQTVNADTYCGISLFVPQDIYTTNADRCTHGDHNANFKSTRWYEAAGWAQTGW